MPDGIDDQSQARAWSTAMHLRQQIAATAASVAETEDWVADTLDRLANARPHDAERLRARAAHARTFAARERAQAAIYRCAPGNIPADLNRDSGQNFNIDNTPRQWLGVHSPGKQEKPFSRPDREAVLRQLVHLPIQRPRYIRLSLN